jgi:hypothetical protein
MQIFNSDVGDPMLSDSVPGLEELQRRFIRFLASDAERASFPARMDGNPEPYKEFLGGLRVRKDLHTSQLHISLDRWLELAGPLAELQQFAKLLAAPTNGNHGHWYSTPVSLIIEADDWRAQQR